MNKQLLIFCDNGYGIVAKEIAKSMGIYHKIKLITNLKEININTLEEKVIIYNHAFPVFEDAEKRVKWINKLEELSFTIPILISPKANISPSSQIGRGTLVEPFVSISNETFIGKGCILETNSTIKPNSIISDGSIVKSNAIICENTIVPAGTTIDFHCVYKNANPKADDLFSLK